MIIDVVGTVFSGTGQGRKYTTLNWLKKFLKKELGYYPYPGTLNIYLSSQSELYNMSLGFNGLKISSPKGYFSGKIFKALFMERVDCAVIQPDVPNYPKNILEVVSPINLREEFRLKDGDSVKVKIRLV